MGKRLASALAVALVLSLIQASGAWAETYWGVWRPGAGYQALGDIFSKCTNFSGGNINDSCEEVPPVEVEGLGCEAVPRLKDLLSQNKKASDSIKCRGKKMEALKTELACLSSQAQTLDQQLATMQSEYVRNIQYFQKQVGEYKAFSADIGAQIQDIDLKLGGTESRPGMVAVQQEALALIGGMEAEILQAEQAKTQVETMKKTHTEHVRLRSAALARECLAPPSAGADGQASSDAVTASTAVVGSSMKCDGNAQAASPAQYLYCMYYQKLLINEDGTIEKGEFTKRKAAERAGELSYDIMSILNQMPSSADVPTSPEGNSAAAAKSNAFLTWEQLEAAINLRFKKYDSGDYKTVIQVQDWLKNTAKKCFVRGQSKVQEELKMASSTLGSEATAITSLEKEAKAAASTTLGGYSNLWTKMVKAVSGNHVPLNTSACNGGSMEVQLGCLKDAKRNIEELYNGTGTQTEYTLLVKAVRAQNNATLKCSGLEGCVNALTNLKNDRQLKLQQTDSQMKSFVTGANSEIINYTKQMATMLQSQSQMLDARLKQLNAALGGLDISGIQMDRIDGEELDQDQDGLYQIPKDMRRLVGGMMSPPMLDVSGNNFDDATRDLGVAIRENGKEIADVAKAHETLSGLRAKCDAEKAKEIKEELDEMKKDIKSRWRALPSGCALKVESDCDTAKGYSDAGGKGLGDLTSQIKETVHAAGAVSNLNFSWLEGLTRGYTCQLTSAPAERDATDRSHTQPSDCSAVYTEVTDMVDEFEKKAQEYNKAKSGK